MRVGERGPFGVVIADMIADQPNRLSLDILVVLGRSRAIRRPDRSGIEKCGSPSSVSVTVMDITIHVTFLPHDDPDASLAFYRDVLGFEVRGDVGSGKMRWITVGPAGQPGTSIVLHRS